MFVCFVCLLFSLLLCCLLSSLLLLHFFDWLWTIPRRLLLLLITHLSWWLPCPWQCSPPPPPPSPPWTRRWWGTCRRSWWSWWQGCETTFSKIVSDLSSSICGSKVVLERQKSTFKRKCWYPDTLVPLEISADKRSILGWMVLMSQFGLNCPNGNISLTPLQIISLKICQLILNCNNRVEWKAGLFWAETLVEVGGGWCGDWGGGKLAGYLSAEPQPTSNHTLAFGIREIQFITHTKRNRINRIREIHGGRWCGRKVACYQLSGCCGRSSQASTSIWTPHLAFPFPHHHTSALPHSEPTQNKSDTLFTKLCMHFVDFVKLSSVSSQRQKYYTCHIGFGTTGQQREFLDVFRSVFS